MTEERFNELLETYASNGSAGESESRELWEAFEVEPTLRTRFVDELRILNGLHGVAWLDGDENRIADEVLQSILPVEEIFHDLSAEVLTKLRPTPKRRWVQPTQIAAGIAAAFAVLWLVSINSSSSPSLAIVAHQINAEWSQNPGSELGTGRIHLLSGLVRLDFGKGVRVTLEGPAVFELIGPEEARLHSGSLTAHVPPEGIGFLVHTERAKVVDLGTTFGVSVGANGETDVSVYEGEVEVTSLASLEEKVIYEGNSVTLDKSPKMLTTAKLSGRTFRGWPVLFGVLNTGGSVRFVKAQAVKNPADVADGENIVVFPERHRNKLRKDIIVSLTQPGSYRSEALIAGEEILARSDASHIGTYLIQYNPPREARSGNSEQRRFTGEVTLDRPIIGVIADLDQLLATDRSLGKRTLEYPDALRRDLEHGDHLTLSEDRRTLKIDWLVNPTLKTGMDQIRVIVDASEVPQMTSHP